MTYYDDDDHIPCDICGGSHAPEVGFSISCPDSKEFKENRNKWVREDEAKREAEKAYQRKLSRDIKDAQDRKHIADTRREIGGLWWDDLSKESVNKSLTKLRDEPFWTEQKNGWSYIKGLVKVTDAIRIIDDSRSGGGVYKAITLPLMSHKVVKYRNDLVVRTDQLRGNLHLASIKVMFEGNFIDVRRAKKVSDRLIQMKNWMWLKVEGDDQMREITNWNLKLFFEEGEIK